MIYTVDLCNMENGLEVVSGFFYLYNTAYVDLTYLADRGVFVEDTVEESMKRTKESIIKGDRFCLNNLHRWIL